MCSARALQDPLPWFLLCRGGMGMLPPSLKEQGGQPQKNKLKGTG